MSSRHVVVDASVVLRLILDESPEAEDVIRNDDLAAPGILVPEIANALASRVRFAGMKLADAVASLDECLDLPIELVPDAELAADAVALAPQLDLSAYDASYAALADRLQVPLITADRRLAARYPRSELIP
jgi:predicted nucleic acid-binding protein